MTEKQVLELLEKLFYSQYFAAVDGSEVEQAFENLTREVQDRMWRLDDEV